MTGYFRLRRVILAGVDIDSPESGGQGGGQGKATASPVLVGLTFDLNEQPVSLAFYPRREK